MTIHLCLSNPIRQFPLYLIIYSGYRALLKVTAALDIWNNVMSRPYVRTMTSSYHGCLAAQGHRHYRKQRTC